MKDLRINSLYPIITYWVRPLAVNIGECMHVNCTNDAGFMLFNYEDHFEAANLVLTKQLLKQEAERLVWEKSVREQTSGILKEYAHIPICTNHLAVIMQHLVGQHAILAYIMPSLMMGTKLTGDAAIFRFKKDYEVFNMVVLPRNCKTVEELREFIMQQTPKNI